MDDNNKAPPPERSGQQQPTHQTPEFSGARHVAHGEAVQAIAIWRGEFRQLTGIDPSTDGDRLVEMLAQGAPLGMTFAPLVVVTGDTFEDMRTEIQSCSDAIERSLEAQNGRDRAIAALEAALHLGKAGLDAYAVADPVASMTEGGPATGGMALAMATDSGAGASAISAPAAVKMPTGALLMSANSPKDQPGGGGKEEPKVGEKQTGKSSEAGKGAYTVDDGAKPTAGERAAASYWLDQGKNVRALKPVSESGVEGVRTADLEVEGVGTVDIYEPTPETPAKRVVGGILKKSGQAEVIQVELAGSGVTAEEAARLPNRIFGHPSAGSRIKRVVIRQNGNVVVDATRSG